MGVARSDARLLLNEIVVKSQQNRLVHERSAFRLQLRARWLNFVSMIVGVVLGGGIAGIHTDGWLVQIGGPVLGFASALASGYLFIFSLNNRINAGFKAAKRYLESEAEANWFRLQLGNEPEYLSSSETSELRQLYSRHRAIASELTGQQADLVGSTYSLGNPE